MGKNYSLFEKDIEKALLEEDMFKISKLRNKLDYIHKEYCNGIKNN